MTERAVVASVEDGEIKVIESGHEDCMSCTVGCGKKHNMEVVDNPQNFGLEVGDVVIIGASKKVQAVQGIVSLFLPFLSAIGGYFLASPIMKIFGKTISDDFKAVFVLGFLVLRASIVYVVTRKFPIPGRAEIRAVAG